MYRIVGTAGAMMAALALQACDGDRVPAAPSPSVPTTPVTPRVVRGTVLDFQTQAPLANAVVRVGTQISGGTEVVTDVTGRYSMPQPPHSGQSYYFTVNDTLVGRGYPVGADYRGDLLVNPGTCVARYGVVIDARTLQPLAEVSLAIFTNTLATTGTDGWYRVDWGCPASGWVGFNTTFLRASHPNYFSRDELLGRGIGGAQRLDFILSPK